MPFVFHPESIDAILIPSNAELEFLVAASTYAIEYCPVEGDSRLLTLVTGGAIRCIGLNRAKSVLVVPRSADVTQPQERCNNRCQDNGCDREQARYCCRDSEV